MKRYKKNTGKGEEREGKGETEIKKERERY